jgi:pyrimidine-nucleoside phosphorylase
MRIIDIIEKKKRGEELSGEEIAFSVNGYVAGDIPDYQMSALLMAIWFRGMTSRETTDLTLTMAHSGDRIDLSAIPGTKVDKHSTGGVADSTTLVVAPMVAACGGRVAKMSGRGLGHTGGTIDKLESIPGFQVSQTTERFTEIVSTIGLSVIGQTGNLVPADKKIYALRDVTGTVDNVSLIAGSIMSKKIAAGSDAIVLDVKAGTGAFMKEVEHAEALARMMVDIGNHAGRKTVAFVTDMNQPLGNAVGTALEVKEAIEVLHGKEPSDLRTVAVQLASQMLVLGGIIDTAKEAAAACEASLEDGTALAKLAAMIEAQGGEARVTEDTSLLPEAERTDSVQAVTDGWIGAIDAEAIGVAAMTLGAGRLTKEDSIDPAVGIRIKKRLGERVSRGGPLAEFYGNDESKLADARAKFEGAITITKKAPRPVALVHAFIE